MRIFYIEKAVEQLKKLPRLVQERIANKMRFYALQENPLVFAKPLIGYNVYRFRIGEYRVVCEARKGILIVLMIVKRDKAYGNL